jgi:hypothetical protein
VTRRDEYRETSQDINYGMRQGTKITLWVAALIILLTAAFWAIHVATSGPRGQGDAYAQKNSAANWTKAQAEFNQRYQGIQALDKNVTQAAVALKRNPKDTRRQIEYDGNVRNCNDAVSNYNSLSRSYLAEDFRDADLPYQIDDTDPTTDCKEN